MECLNNLADLAPFRTELSIFANDENGNASVAGQIDFLMKDADGGLHMIDFKRTPNDLSDAKRILLRQEVPGRVAAQRIFPNTRCSSLSTLKSSSFRPDVAFCRRGF